MGREKKLLGEFNERSEQEHLIQTREFVNEECTQQSARDF
jgi:hypothetical protein